jgi:DNA-binding transcriptional LysR family regulator
LGLIEALSEAFASFLVRFPKARLQVVALDRPVDLIDERMDLAIRVRATLDTDASLLMRTLGHSPRILVAAPKFAAHCASGDIGGLPKLPTLATTEQIGEIAWDLWGPEEEKASIRHEPRMTCTDFAALRDAAAQGLGIALLPEHTCRGEIESGKLIRVFPQWRGAEGIIHIVFTTRRGLPPVVRAFIDHLASTCQEMAIR